MMTNKWLAASIYVTLLIPSLAFAQLQVPPDVRSAAVNGGCGADPSAAAVEASQFDLGGPNKPRLWIVPCMVGAYNALSAIVIQEPGRPARRLLFADWIDGAWTGTDQLANVSYDPRTRQLTAFRKDRGLGDCGASGVWAWTGEDFKLVTYRAKSTCDGKDTPFPVVFPSR